MLEQRRQCKCCRQTYVRLELGELQATAVHLNDLLAGLLLLSLVGVWASSDGSRVGFLSVIISCIHDETGMISKLNARGGSPRHERKILDINEYGQSYRAQPALPHKVGLAPTTRDLVQILQAIQVSPESQMMQRETWRGLQSG